MVVAQAEVLDARSEETTIAPPVLAQIDLNDRVVTADALRESHWHNSCIAGTERKSTQVKGVQLGRAVDAGTARLFLHLWEGLPWVDSNVILTKDGAQAVHASIGRGGNWHGKADRRKRSAESRY
ncbi:hypothetical protein [Actinomadura vinacea]|uniref:hypothetical protein n=1 Tax=Actinomadura vinacea TaxID=115336 RepID=UPI0031DA0F1A